MDLLMLFLISAVLGLLFFYFQNRGQILKKLGIPGPEPKFLIGNIFDVFGADTVPQEKFQEWTKQYGPVYGYMDGGKPTLVVSDPEMIQEIFIKKFTHFTGRKDFPVTPDPESNDDRVHMFIARGQKWKRLRTIINPTFTAAKIKQTWPKVYNCVDEMMRILEQKTASGKSFDVYNVYKCMGMDIIGRVAFAMKSSIQRDENNELLQLANGFLSRQGRVFEFCGRVFPELSRLVWAVAIGTARIRNVEWLFLQEKMVKMVQEKRQMKEQLELEGVDFLNMLLNAEANPEATVGDLTVENGDLKTTQLMKKLTAGEIASQSMLFLLAGYETTSTTLAFATDLLAKNPDVQEKLLAEIDDHFQDLDSITYESIQKLPYLDCVIQETLRMYPVGSPSTNRLCVQSCEINGTPIPKGAVVYADVFSLHFNEELWGSDAREFRPERFLPDHVPKSPPHPGAYMPFGIGPRSCIGTRFAILELKLAMCSILSRYRFVKGPETEDPLRIRCTGITVTPKTAVNVILKQRNSK